jgi:hypothetical protein
MRLASAANPLSGVSKDFLHVSNAPDTARKVFFVSWHNKSSPANIKSAHAVS